MEVSIRPGNAQDGSFIFSTWLRGLYYGNDLFGQIPAETYYQKYQAVLTNLLTMPGTETRVATLPGEPDVIVGYSVHSGPTLHWCFVKAPFRKQGVAAQLVAGTGTKFVSHITKPGNAIRKKQGWAFNPFL